MPPHDMTAYDLFLRGLHIFDSYGTDIVAANARQLFKQAIERDPRFARAYTYIAFSIFRDVFMAVVDTSHLSEAHDAIQKAIELNPDDAFSQAVHGLVLYMMGRKHEV